MVLLVCGGKNFNKVCWDGIMWKKLVIWFGNLVWIVLVFWLVLMILLNRLLVGRLVKWIFLNGIKFCKNFLYGDLFRFVME